MTEGIRAPRRRAVRFLTPSDAPVGGVCGIGPDGFTAAAPLHAEHVRRLFVDALTPNQLGTFARLTQRVSDHMDKQPD